MIGLMRLLCKSSVVSNFSIISLLLFFFAKNNGVSPFLFFISVISQSCCIKEIRIKATLLFPLLIAI